MAFSKEKEAYFRELENPPKTSRVGLLSALACRNLAHVGIGSKSGALDITIALLEGALSDPDAGRHTARSETKCPRGSE